MNWTKSMSTDERNSHTGNDPRIPFPRFSALRINFKYQCRKIWNELPHYITDARNLGHFKKTLLSYFLELGYQDLP